MALPTLIQKLDKQKFILYTVCMAMLLSFGACRQQNAMPPLQETFAGSDKNPFGGFIARSQLEAMYYRNNIRDKKKSFDKTWNDIGDTASLYVCMTPRLYVNEDERTAMLNYVYAGNTLFIAANIFDEDLLSQVKCTQYTSVLNFFDSYDSLRNTNTTALDTNYSYYYKPFKNSFNFTDSIFTKVLGVNETGKPNFILYYHGRGKLILHCDPKAFSNYFLLKENNYKYMQHAFSYTSSYPDHIYWDDYYRKLRGRRPGSNSSDGEGSFSSFSVILANNALAWAFWLSLLLLLLYILFAGKRRQRIIEKIKPNENATVTFAETIGRLYLQKKDNKNIAEKMITYFNEYVRNNYFVNTNVTNNDFITTLSRKSGVEYSKVESLYRAIHQINNNTEVDDYQLLSLNEQIQHFYKK